MKVRLKTTDGMLGTASGNPELYEEFIGAKSKDAEKVKEEVNSLPADELVEKTMAVFHRDKDGNPILYDYQIRGFLKEALGTMVEFGPITVGKAKISKWTHKRFVDNFIFVTPRNIPLIMPEGGEVTTCTRPLRATTMKGERVALAHSEEVPEGTTLEFSINITEPKLEKIVRDALDFGVNKGLGAWRNSGKGRFTWDEI